MKHQGQTTSETMSIVSLGFALMGISFRYGRGFESSAGRAARRDGSGILSLHAYEARGFGGAGVVNFTHHALEIDRRQDAIKAPGQGDVRSQPALLV